MVRFAKVPRVRCCILVPANKPSLAAAGEGVNRSLLQKRYQNAMIVFERSHPAGAEWRLSALLGTLQKHCASPQDKHFCQQLRLRVLRSLASVARAKGQPGASLRFLRMAKGEAVALTGRQDCSQPHWREILELAIEVPDWYQASEAYVHLLSADPEDQDLLRGCAHACLWVHDLESCRAALLQFKHIFMRNKGEADFASAYPKEAWLLAHVKSDSGWRLQDLDAGDKPQRPTGSSGSLECEVPASMLAAYCNFSARRAVWLRQYHSTT